MSLIPKDLTPILQSTFERGTGSARWQRPTWVDHLPPCNVACPAGENIQGWLAFAREGKFEEAWRTLVRDNPMPATHGRACYHPCESKCNRGELDEAVAIHAVERLLGDLALREGWNTAPGVATGKKVLIVGAGPAGLSCAWHLRLLGHEVEIRDAMEKPGGMLHYGIPAYRLPRDGLLAEIRRIEAVGVRFVMNSRVDDVAGAMRDGGFDACFVAIGAHAANHLDIPAADGREMVDAIRLLEQVEEGKQPRLGRVVGIVGGGNTAMDAARVAKRLGAEEAILIYRRDRSQMRADPYEADEAFLEGVKAKWLHQPRRFGREGVTVEKIAISVDGSLQPTGELETLPLDALVLALGQHAEVDFLRQLPAIAIEEDSTVAVDRDLMTGHPGVFAGGDVIGGLRTMTAATGHGKKAARTIDAWMRGEKLAQRAKAPAVDFAALHLPLYLDAGRSPVSALPLEARAGFDEVVGGIDESQARYESDRCLACGNCFECDNCFAACPEQAVVKLGRGNKYAVNLSLCTGCAVCFEQCPCHAIEMVPEPQAAGAVRQPTHFRARP